MPRSFASCSDKNQVYSFSKFNARVQVGPSLQPATSTSPMKLMVHSSAIVPELISKALLPSPTILSGKELRKTRSAPSLRIWIRLSSSNNRTSQKLKGEQLLRSLLAFQFLARS